jgi:hypothetical protein
MENISNHSEYCSSPHSSFSESSNENDNLQEEEIEFSQENIVLKINGTKLKKMLFQQ